ncbi:hypothetical protein B0T26DRAFT_807850 [Lasiosphaeria miniovina]|uniref:Uncharacterized protein n=1 Tax=Lasiosphaeria miniovina TaxID=1954250 RepID=A0AA39ZR47_9PEZI|nr:uncharacterized protein B0T26DRAFT_807850 [Lasiosphaeria miniovina]KAK0702043.1 hypothetical protein B0T26DRAFT_807850 [Lasiosphaeria miniovina]
MPRVIGILKDALDLRVGLQQRKWHWVVIDLPERGLGGLPIDNRSTMSALMPGGNLHRITFLAMVKKNMVLIHYLIVVSSTTLRHGFNCIEAGGGGIFIGYIYVGIGFIGVYYAYFGRIEAR